MFGACTKNILTSYRFFIQCQNMLGQEMSRIRRNTIKLDITSNLVYRNALNVSYERVTKPNQTLFLLRDIKNFPRFFPWEQESNTR